MNPNDPKKPLIKPRPVAPGARKTVPGPTMREGAGSLPCGCKVAPDPEDNKLRYWFCSPHAVAYEMLEIMQEMQLRLDELLNNAPPELDTTAAMEVSIKSKKVLRKAKGDWR